MKGLLLLAALLAAGCATAPPPAPLPDGVTLVAAVTIERTAPYSDLVTSPSPDGAPVRAWARVETVYRGEADGEVSFLVDGDAVATGDRVVVFLAPTTLRVPWRSAAPPAPYSPALDAALR